MSSWVVLSGVFLVCVRNGDGLSVNEVDREMTCFQKVIKTR